MALDFITGSSVTYFGAWSGVNVKTVFIIYVNVVWDRNQRTILFLEICRNFAIYENYSIYWLLCTLWTGSLSSFPHRV